MARRYPNPRLIKIHRSYSVAELAEKLGKHRNTIRNWHQNGLAGFRDGRQIIFHGTEIRRFLDDKRSRGKRKCPPGTLYCFTCNEPRKPAFDEVELHNAANGRRGLTALCSDCVGVMKQTVSAERLGIFQKILKVTTQPASIRQLEDPSAIENCD